MIEIATDWKDYQLIDAGNKDKLEIWKDVVLVRPNLKLFGKKDMTTDGISLMLNIKELLRKWKLGF